MTSVPVYGWALPEDTGPLRRTIAEIAEGRVGAVVFTSAQQVVHLLEVAAQEGREARASRRRTGRTQLSSPPSAPPPPRPSRCTTPCPSTSSPSIPRWVISPSPWPLDGERSARGESINEQIRNHSPTPRSLRDQGWPGQSDGALPGIDIALRGTPSLWPDHQKRQNRFVPLPDRRRRRARNVG